MRKVKFTNPEWKNLGPPTGAKRHCLENLDPMAKKNRRKWQDNLSGTPLPSGPYPVFSSVIGWYKAHIYTREFQSCYVSREDVNLNIEIFHVLYDEDRTPLAREQVEDEETLVRCRLIKDTYDYFTHGIREAEFDDDAPRVSDLTIGDLKTIILNEVTSWVK